MHNCAILHVEDDDAAAYLFRAALDEADIAVSVYRVCEGKQALAFLHKSDPYGAARTPELVVLDLNLPGIDGWSVLAEIRRTEELAALPVVVLTASDHPKDRQKARLLGAQYFMTKPTKFEAFVDEIRQYCLPYLKQPTSR